MHSQTIHQQKTYNAHSVYINTHKYKSTNLTPKHTYNINIPTSLLNKFVNAKSQKHAFTHNTPTQNI